MSSGRLGRGRWPGAWKVRHEVWPAEVHKLFAMLASAASASHRLTLNLPSGKKKECGQACLGKPALILNPS